MIKKHIRRLTPDHNAVKEHKHLRLLGSLLHDPNLFHLNRRSVSGAFGVGLFWAMIPIPMQMVAAALTSILLRTNLPISVALVWLSNPLTMPPMFYFNYLVGTWILGAPADIGDFQFTMEWITNELGQIWLPLYFGSLVVGVIASALGYIAIRLYWRWHIIKLYRQRKMMRQQTGLQNT